MNVFQPGTGRIVDRASQIALASHGMLALRSGQCGFWFHEWTGDSPPPSLVPSRTTRQEDAPIYPLSVILCALCLATPR